MMEKLIKELVEHAKTDYTVLRKLKIAAVNLQSYELAASLREIEKENFPERKEIEIAHDEAAKLNTLFNMVDLNISDDNCWLIKETLAEYDDSLGDFTIDDAVKLKQRKEYLFLK